MTLILSGTDGLSDVDGSAATPAIRGTDANTGIFFGTDIIGFSEGGVEAMRINSSGFVGIGTTTPQRKLSIVGTDGATGQTEGNSRTSLFLDNNGANYLSIFTGTSGDGAVFFSDNGNNNGGIVYQTSSDALYFRANNAERARIDSSGRLLVNVTALSNLENGTTNSVCLRENGTIEIGKNATSANNVVEFFNPNGNVGKISISGSATSYVTSSDYRLKDNIAPMTGALAKVALLKPCTYKWKVDGSDGQGFIAHELDEVVQGCVTGEKDAVNEDGSIKPQGIDTSFLVATLTAAIQEQQALITQLQADVAALKGQP